MAIYYVDLATGSDAAAGTAGAPLLTINAAIAKASGPHDIRVAKTTAHTTVGGANTWTWTVNSATVSVNADVTATVAVGDYIGKPTVAQGTIDTFYRVASRTFGSGVTTIILSSKHQGTSGTTTGALKASFVTTGSAAANAVTVSVSGTQISGGWNLSGTPTQDGETWAKSNNVRTTAVAFFALTSTNAQISKFNVIDTYYGVNATNTCTGLTITDCNFVTYQRSAFLNITASDLIATRANFQNEPVGETVYFSNGSTTQKTFNNCWVFNGTNLIRFGIAQSAGMGSTTSSVTFSNGTILAGSTGIGVAYAIGPVYVDFSDTTIRHCLYGTSCPSGTKIKGGNFSFNTTGVYASTVNGIDIRNAVFNGNTSGIADRMFSGRIEDCTFGDTSPNTYDIYQDQYAGNIDIINCTTTAPNTNFLFTVAAATTMRMSNLSIDAASAAKVFNNPTGWNATHPLLIANNIDTNGGTAFPDGYYFPSFYFVEDSSVTSSTGSSFRLQFNTASANNINSEVLLGSTYTESGVGKEFTYKIQANSGWAGQIIPIVRLNGSLIQTETTITSISTSWVQKTITIVGASVVEDGVLEVLIIPNANTTPAYFDDGVFVNI